MKLTLTPDQGSRWRDDFFLYNHSKTWTTVLTLLESAKNFKGLLKYNASNMNFFLFRG